LIWLARSFLSAFLSEHLANVKSQLLDGLFDIVESAVIALLVELPLRSVYPHNNFQAGHIQNAIVEERIELRHFLTNEQFIRMNRVPRDDELPLLNALRKQKLQDDPLRLLSSQLALDALLNEPRIVMMGGIPLFHLFEVLLGREQHQLRSLYEALALAVGKDAGDLQQLILVNIETRHLAVNP